jgi:hypothetical protein
MKKHEISKNSTEAADKVDIDVDQLSEDRDIPSPQEEDQLQGGNNLNNISEGSDDGNARSL